MKSFLIVLVLCSSASAGFEIDMAFDRFHWPSGTTTEIVNEELQPFDATFRLPGLFVLGVSLNFSFDLSLNNPAPIGLIDPSEFSVSNITGSWGSYEVDELADPRGNFITGDFELPIEVLSARAYPDGGFLASVGVVGDPTIVDVVVGDINGLPGVRLNPQMPSPIHLTTAAVPEPSQYLMLGIVAVGLIAARFLRRV